MRDARDQIVTLLWSRFSRMTEARNAYRHTACVYIQTDGQSNILRIGKASKGLEARYRGGTAYAIDAGMHGSGNSVFVAGVERSLCSAVESELIWQLRDRLDYNNQGKLNRPALQVKLKHRGEVPRLGVERRPKN